MSDVRGGLVKFTKLRRNYTGEGVYDLVEDGETWLPERSFRLEAGTHEGVDFLTVTPLAGAAPFYAADLIEDVLTRQEEGLEQTRPTTTATPEP